VLDRSFFDHCPIILKNATNDWGPKPFRTLDCWFLEHGFKEKVKELWNSYVIQGKCVFVLKEKIKLLKKDQRK